MLTFLIGVGTGCVATYAVMAIKSMVEALESIDEGDYREDDAGYTASYENVI
jgi:hypothetical protein